MNEITLPAHSTLVAHDTVGPDALREFFDHYYPLLHEFTESVGVLPQAARAYYFSPPGEAFDIAAGFVIADEDLDLIAPLIDDIGDGHVSLKRFEEIEAVVKRVTCAYSDLGAQWDEFAAATEADGHAVDRLLIEEYVTMGDDQDAPVTDLFIPLTRPQ